MRLKFGIDRFYVYAYNDDQVFLPNHDKKFGSHYLSIEAPKKRDFGAVYRYSQDYEISRTHWKQVDTTELRCKQTGTAGNTTRCITGYLEKEIGCSVGLQGSNPEAKV